MDSCQYGLWVICLILLHQDGLKLTERYGQRLPNIHRFDHLSWTFLKKLFMIMQHIFHSEVRNPNGHHENMRKCTY